MYSSQLLVKFASYQTRSFWKVRLRLTVSFSSLAAAAAAAKSLQSCPTLCDPIDGSPPGSPVPGILQARTLEWVAISFSNAWKWKGKAKSLSHVRLFSTLWTAPTRLLHPWDFQLKVCLNRIKFTWLQQCFNLCIFFFLEEPLNCYLRNSLLLRKLHLY